MALPNEHALMGLVSGLLKGYVDKHKPCNVVAVRLAGDIPAVFVKMNEADDGWYMLTSEPIEQSEVATLMGAIDPDVAAINALAKP